MSRYGDGRRDGMSRCPCCQHQHTLVLVGCGAGKVQAECEARDLYTGTLFRKARAFAEQRGDDWFILSAGYGLLYPGRRILPYDRTLKGATRDFRRMWAQGVGSSLWGFRESRIIVLAGNDYCGWIDPKDWPHVERPLEGMAIGQQLQYLTKHTTPAKESEPAMPLNRTPNAPKLTARQVRSEFNHRWAHRCREVPALADDKPAARQFWSVMLDELYAEGQITDAMLQSVTYPPRLD